MGTCIYTKQELIDFIKAIDLKLNEAIEMSSLDTNQGKQSFGRQIKALEDQRNRYYRMLQQFYPDNYNDIINFTTSRRGGSGHF